MILIRKNFYKFLLSLTFFTRLPLTYLLVKMQKKDPCFEVLSLRDSALFFPICGLVIAFISAAFWMLISSLLPPLLASGLTMLILLLLTGALHEDGLADLLDGMGAEGERDKALAIMADSRIGSYGVSALIFSIGLRWAALSLLLPLNGAFALIIAHSSARAALAIPMSFSIPAKEKGLGASLVGKLPVLHLALALGAAIIIALLAGGIGGLIVITVAFIAAALLMIWLDKRLGGYTGDGLGAIEQICEIIILCLLAGLWT